MPSHPTVPAHDIGDDASRSSGDDRVRRDEGPVAPAPADQSPLETGSWDETLASAHAAAAEQATWPAENEGTVDPPATTVADWPFDVEGPVVPRSVGEAVPTGFLAHYRLIRLLGRGNMGIVFLAHDLTLNRAVALKVLTPERAGDANARLRFVREARAAAAIHHENVVPVYAVSQVGGLPFLVMKYVEGRSLEDKLRKEGPLAPGDVVRIGIQIASGLAAAHARGLVHRDVKPSNLLLDGPAEDVRISDFGLARAVDDPSLTLTGAVAGTPLYMAPEQARGDAVDHRADLYSLGSVLYALCVGRAPFQGASTGAVLRRVVDEPPPAVHDVRPSIPAELSGLIAKLHAIDPADRFQTAAEVADGLRAIAGLAGAPASAAAAAAAPAPAAASPVSPRRRRRRRRWVLAAVPAFVLTATLGLTEAAGVTRVSQLVRTVLNIRTPSGTLMVEVDDPGISVEVEDAGEQITIKGKGFHEVSVRPGRHAVKASKDGALSDEDLVTIKQGGRQLVKVTRSGNLVAESAPAEARVSVRAHAQGATGVAFRPPNGGRLASVGYDRTVKLWDPESGRPVTTLSGHTQPVFSVAYAPDGRMLATAGWDRVVRLWDGRTGKAIGSLNGHTHWVWSVAFSPDGATLASAGADVTIRVWDIATRRERFSFPSQTIVRNLAFTPDGKFLVTASDASVGSNLVVWDLKTKDVVQFLEGHPGGSVCLAFSPDRATLASGGYDRSVAIWDVATWKLRTRLAGHNAPVYAVAFSPDGRLLASGDGDYREPNRAGLINIWNVSTHRLLKRLRGHEGGVIAAAFAPQGTELATASFDERVKLWDLRELSVRKRSAR